MMPISLVKSRNNSSAFTLIEVLIAMTLLAFLSIAIYQATTRSFIVNYQLTNESSEYQTISAALAILDEDISQIYTPALGSEKTMEGSESPSDYWGPPIRADGLRRTRLKGSSDKVWFITTGNRRFERDSPQSDFLKVSWEIAQNKSGAYSLYRTVDWDAFSYQNSSISERKPQRVAILNNLSNGKFSYYRKYDKTWTDNWDTEGTFVNKQSRYPDMISLKMELPDPTNNANNKTWESNFIPNISLNLNGQLVPAQQQSLDRDAIQNNR